MLADFLSDRPDGDDRARKLYRDFQAAVVAGLGGGWSLRGDQIAEYLALSSL